MGAIREIKQKYFGEGDLEAFFGLFGDVFSKIAAIIGVLYFAEGFPADIVMGKILPGIGVGSIAGSLIPHTEQLSFFRWYLPAGT